MKKSFIISMLLSLVSLGVALWFIMTTEGQVPTHWGAGGEITSYGSPWYMIIFPITAFFVTLLMYFLPMIDPKGDNIRKSGPILQVTMFLVVGLMLGIQAFTIIATKGGDIMNMTTFVSVAIGVMFIVLGYFMPNVKPNYMVGIRTPWTLFSESVWIKTHKESAKWMILGGVLYLIGIFFPGPVGIIIPTIVIIFIFIGITWYSYLVYVDEKSKKKTKK